VPPPAPGAAERARMSLLVRNELWLSGVLEVAWRGWAAGRCGVGRGGRCGVWSGWSELLRTACSGSGKALAREALLSFSISLRGCRAGV
jgi:hypothetical protein